MDKASYINIAQIVDETIMDSGLLQKNFDHEENENIRGLAAALSTYAFAVLENLGKTIFTDEDKSKLATAQLGVKVFPAQGKNDALLHAIETEIRVAYKKSQVV